MLVTRNLALCSWNEMAALPPSSCSIKCEQVGFHIWALVYSHYVYSTNSGLPEAALSISCNKQFAHPVFSRLFFLKCRCCHRRLLRKGNMAWTRPTTVHGSLRMNKSRCLPGDIKVRCGLTSLLWKKVTDLVPYRDSVIPYSWCGGLLVTRNLVNGLILLSS